MTTSLPNTLARALHAFFADYLPQVRGLSPHTLHSYRDSLMLLLRYVAAQRGCQVAVLDIGHLTPEVVVAFLQDLEDSRGNLPTTRNVRLAALHAFFRYLALQHPDALEQAQRVLAIPCKRAGQRAVEYLDYAEIQAVLAAIDRSHADGERDYTLLATLFNTGARVQELLDVRPLDLQLIKPYQVRLIGKGHKARICPLWPQTAAVLKAYCQQQGIDLNDAQPLFRNHRGGTLTRYGVRYILAKYVQLAAVTMPSLARKRLHPHTLRHNPGCRIMPGCPSLQL